MQNTNRYGQTHQDREDYSSFTQSFPKHTGIDHCQGPGTGRSAPTSRTARGQQLPRQSNWKPKNSAHRSRSSHRSLGSTEIPEFTCQKNPKKNNTKKKLEGEISTFEKQQRETTNQPKCSRKTACHTWNVIGVGFRLKHGRPSRQLLQGP